MKKLSPRAQEEAAAYPAETRGINFFDSDLNLQRLLQRLAPDMLEDYAKELHGFGAWAGGELDAQAAYSDRYAPPRLETHDRHGRKNSRVVLNPRYEQCHREAYARGILGFAFQEKNPAPHLLSFTMGYLLSQADISIHCPVTMTGAIAYVLDKFADPEVRAEFLPELTRMDGEAKSGGTWATEEHGGSDVGATTTRAVKDGKKFRLYGLKWFTSNASSGLALATARPEGAPEGGKGLGLYLVPAYLKDGAPNSYSIRRLKDKLGTRALATGEIDLDGAEAIEIAAPPHGLKMMMEALGYSRIHNAMSAAGVQRRAFLEAVCWASHREAFGGKIINYPMVQDELIDLMVRGEAGAALAFEAAGSFDAALADEDNRPWLRLATALAKYRTAEDGIQSAKKALEIVGGNGYTEEFPTARQFRDAMVLTVWEGPANIQALELLRLVGEKQDGGRIFLDRLRDISRGLPVEMTAEKELLGRALKESEAALSHLREHPQDGRRLARKLMDRLCDALGGALLCEGAAHDLSRGDARKKIIAGRYLEKTFGVGDGGIHGAPDITQILFHELVNYAMITPATLKGIVR